MPDNGTTTITVSGSDNNNQEWLPPLIYTGLGVFAACILAGLYTFRREGVKAYQASVQIIPIPGTNINDCKSLCGGLPKCRSFI
jgi:hypothetical protein